MLMGSRSLEVHIKPHPFWDFGKDWWRCRSVAAVYNRPSVWGCARGSYCYKGEYLSKSSNSPLVTPIFYIRIGFRAKFRFRGSISELIYIYSYMLLSYIYMGDNQRTYIYICRGDNQRTHTYMKISSLPNSYTGNRLGRVPEPQKLTLMLYILNLYSNLSYDLPHPCTVTYVTAHWRVE